MLPRGAEAIPGQPAAGYSLECVVAVCFRGLVNVVVGGTTEPESLEGRTLLQFYYQTPNNNTNTHVDSEYKTRALQLSAPAYRGDRTAFFGFMDAFQRLLLTIWLSLCGYSSYLMLGE